MNSLYNPADSMTPILHFPYVNPSMAITCYYCNDAIVFNKNLNRYESNSGIRCRKAGN